MRVQWLCYAIVLVVGMARVSWAQEPEPLEEVVVTATKAQMPKKKVTKSVSVITADDIERQQATTVLEVLRNVPGVFVRQSGAIGRTTSVVIRGSTDDQVLVLVDGVDVSSTTTGLFNFSTMPAASIERIEVLRGSSSTLYDSKAIGGVINIVTKRGEGPFRVSYQQEIGTLRTFQETVTAQGEEGPLRYHVGVTRLDSSGLGQGNDVFVTHVSAAGRLKITDGIELDVAFTNNDSHVGIDDGAFRPDPNNFVEREHLTLSTTLTMQPTESWEQELRFLLNDDDTNNVDVANPGTSELTSQSIFNTTRFGMDWIHRFGIGQHGLLTAGVDLRDEEAESERFTKTIVTWAGFLQHQQELTDRLTAIGAVRQLKHSRYGGQTVGETSVSYRVPVIESTLRANFSQGFRAPDLNELFFPNFGNTNLGPEESRSFEAGIAHDWWGGRLGTELSVYHVEIDDLIATVALTPTTFEAQNLGEAEMEGFELDWHLAATDHLRLSGMWSYVDAEEEPSKEELKRIPKNTVGFNVDYDFLDQWRLNVNATLVSHQEERRSSTKRERVKGYAKLDAVLTYQVTEAMQLYGRVENLLNRHYSEVLGFPAAGTLFFIGGKVEL